MFTATVQLSIPLEVEIREHREGGLVARSKRWPDDLVAFGYSTTELQNALETVALNFFCRRAEPMAWRDEYQEM